MFKNLYIDMYHENDKDPWIQSMPMEPYTRELAIEFDPSIANKKSLKQLLQEEDEALAQYRVVVREINRDNLMIRLGDFNAARENYSKAHDALSMRLKELLK